MTGFIPGNTAVENARALAQSALPDAPVRYDERPRRRIRGGIWRWVHRPGAALRRVVRRPSTAEPPATVSQAPTPEAVAGRSRESCR